MTKKPIYVAQPQLPPLEEFIPYLKNIWESKILTNNGPYHQQLEQALCEHLGVKHIALLTNGTVALVTALQAFHGELGNVSSQVGDRALCTGSAVRSFALE